MRNSGVDGYLSKYEGREVDAAVERVQNLDAELNAKVDKTTTINGKSLDSDIVLNANDVGALADNVNYAKGITWEDNILYLRDQFGRNLSNVFIGTSAITIRAWDDSSEEMSLAPEVRSIDFEELEENNEVSE